MSHDTAIMDLRRDLTDEAMVRLHGDLADLARRYPVEPVTAVAGQLLETQELGFTALEAGPDPDRDRHRYALVAVATGLMAHVSHDLGRSHQAMALARTMYACADNADHGCLRSWARGMQSMIAFWAGRPQEAVRFAESGSAMAAESTGTVACWLTSLLARAHAMLGAVEPTRLALVRADDLRERHVSDDLDALGGQLTFSPARQHCYAAHAYATLPECAQQAAHEATRALALFGSGPAEQRSYRDEAAARCALALSRVHTGEPDGARDALAPVLSLDLPRRVTEVMVSVNRVYTALREPRYADVAVARQLRDEIEFFTQRPASALTN
ncbi:hypothetical protein Cs7R123_41660 [Catellatospora sp. TT07R-123]|uniref:XRE family transcriptional regulator n=1 Tax=Catellatospora sp. TT07R-123 TaxID=2733863 RepID=UPI001B02BA29|nr:XRE family transcriptional regulator [Catellatospora sp. TT07R-123]GHJ46824.1 hypothetical protein Cs7R123_41660 [Catellatospora sp. TT07R-123]